MTATAPAPALPDREEQNNAYLAEGLAWVRDRVAGRPGTARWWEAYDVPGVEPALEVLGDRLGLSRFERLTLLLVAAAELDPDGAVAGDPPSFALALRLLPDPAWDVLSARRPLRHWRLVTPVQGPGQALVTAPLAVDERVVHHIKGLDDLDDRLDAMVRPVTELLDEPLPAAQHDAVGGALEVWRHDVGPGLVPAIELLGADAEVLRGVAASVCRHAGLELHELRVDALPTTGVDGATWRRLWEREARLAPVALYVDTVDEERAAHSALAAWLGDLDSPLLLGCREPWPLPRRAIHLVDAPRPSASEQEDLWRAALGGTTDDTADVPARLAGTLDLNQRAIARAARPGTGDGDTFEAVWRRCQSHTRPRLEALATRIVPAARWDDLVLPEREAGLLHHLVDQVRGRSQVLRHWGFGDRLTRGTGVTALFAGSSGTGKSLAAEVIAGELGLDLFRVDLAGVVSKYIGETERNLRRVFDAADQGGVLLLFDEADALFGRRSEVRDSHDRYANIEVNYLLQRMEDYRGVAVLTTNDRHALDQAFLRRLRFLVTFPFPSPAQRRTLWEHAFPARTPVDDLELDRLTRLAVTGGMIRNIALNAAFCAAGRGTAVSTALVLEMARIEFAKLDLPVDDEEAR